MSRISTNMNRRSTKKGKEKTKSQELELNEVCVWREDEGTRSHKKIRMECNKKWKVRVG